MNGVGVCGSKKADTNDNDSTMNPTQGKMSRVVVVIRRVVVDDVCLARWPLQAELFLRLLWVNWQRSRGMTTNFTSFLGWRKLAWTLNHRLVWAATIVWLGSHAHDDIQMCVHRSVILKSVEKLQCVTPEDLYDSFCRHLEDGNANCNLR
jgi:hypothetical protein